jgi:S1-C subfamily serine protease
VTRRTRPGITTPDQGLFNPLLAPGFVGPYLPIGVGFDAADQGLMITTLDPTSEFFRSGLRQGDIIVSSFGQPIRSEGDLLKLATLYPGQPMPMVVLRGGRQQSLDVILPQDFAQQPRGTESQGYLGASFDVRIPNAAIIVSVDPGSPAETAGLRPGDIITAIEGKRVGTYQHALQILNSMQPGERFDISFSRRVDNQTRPTLGIRPGVGTTTATYTPGIRAERRAVPAVEPMSKGQKSQSPTTQPQLGPGIAN